MPLLTPNLDDRSFEALLQSAKDKVRSSCSAWTDLSPGDPGIVLLEAFSFLTETTIYRLNRVPQKIYIEFLKLLGLTLQPPSAARTTLQFTLPKPSALPILIPRGTRVTSSTGGASQPPVFSTLTDAQIAPGTLIATVDACHCDLIRFESAGFGTGQPAQTIRVAQPPIIAPTGDDLDLVVAVEASSPGTNAATITLANKAFEIWREVPTFAQTSPSDQVYTLDREAGIISFAPAQRAWSGNVLDATELPIAAVPPYGAAIRVSYRRGGGPDGTVPAGVLTVLKDPLGTPLTVTNLTPAVGGNAAESLQHALVRGPRELHALERAVTASDFELLALRSAAVDRARAFTQAARWKYAAGGTVEIAILPKLPPAPPAPGTTELDRIHAQQVDSTCQDVLNIVNARRPMGSTCLVSWVKCKPVQIKATVQAYPEEDKAALQSRLITRLNDLLSPFVPAVVSDGQKSWRFGRSLAVSDVYDTILKEPAVREVSALTLVAESAPDTAVESVARDPFHPGVWYATAQAGLFRTENNGDGWEILTPSPNARGVKVLAHPDLPGLLALCSNLNDGTGVLIDMTADCGETWKPQICNLGPQVRDATWITRSGKPLLILATDKGLYELLTDANATPLQIQVREGDQGFNTVASAVDAKGTTFLAVSARNKGGVFLSNAAGITNSFRNLGLAGEDVQKLGIQRSGSRTFLWAGLGVDQIQDKGTGCKSWELIGSQDPPDGWVAFSNGWLGGSCTALAFAGDSVLAGSYEGGILTLPGHVDGATWSPSDVRSGLPRGTTKEQLLERVDTIAATPDLSLIMEGGLSGLFLSTDSGKTYSVRSSRTFTDFITLPLDWLFCYGNHAIEIRSNDEPSPS